MGIRKRDFRQNYHIFANTGMKRGWLGGPGKKGGWVGKDIGWLGGPGKKGGWVGKQIGWMGGRGQLGGWVGFDRKQVM